MVHHLRNRHLVQQHVQEAGRGLAGAGTWGQLSAAQAPCEAVELVLGGIAKRALFKMINDVTGYTGSAFYKVPTRNCI